jgi:hypothetical protein
LRGTKVFLLKCLLLISLACASLPAAAAIAIIASPKNPISRISLPELSQGFLGMASEFMPIDQKEESAIFRQFYEKVVRRDPREVKAMWARMVFTGIARPPRQFDSDEAIKREVAANDRAVGYIDVNAVDNKVKVLLIIP